MPRRQTTVYVDGFNLFYGALKGQKHYWLDLLKFSQGLLQRENAITRIRYFTALVSATKRDPTATDRQDAYLRALRTLRGLTIHLGSFINDSAGSPREKGSDVNLATYLLLDAFDGRFDVAFVISNDSDLKTPISVVTKRFGYPVGVALPLLNENSDGTQRRASRDLVEVASFVRHINKSRQSLLKASQFPSNVPTRDGRSVSKPASW